MMQLRRPCPCGTETGYIVTKNGQDVVRCETCHGYQYCAPRVETGRDQRSVASRPDMKPSRRRRIIERDGGRCILCGRTDDLHVDHLISRIAADAHGFLDEIIDGDDNLATMCIECNLGKGGDVIDPRIMYRVLVIRQKRP